MNTETHDAFDTNLHALFTSIHPNANFEDRLVNNVRLYDRRRFSMPLQLQKAAIAAAAVIAVGTVGYYGDRAIMGPPTVSSQKVASNLHQIGGAVLLSNNSEWDFGGGSNSAQNWQDRESGGSDKTSKYTNPFARFGKSNGWQPEDKRGLSPSASQTGNKLDSASEVFSRQKATIDADKEIPSLISSQNLNYFHGLADSSAAAGGFDSDKRAIQPTKSLAEESDQSAAKAMPAKISDADMLAARTSIVAANAERTPETPASSPATQPADDRKIIRTGCMNFEVDRFDRAQIQITKIVGELGGFVGATESQRLANGKVQGSIEVRVPPERLDTLVLRLRALGDLTSQQITASDITREYTDLQSELVADRAMQERLLDLIHNGKGSVKDLLAAENELGTWRGKIEKAEGAIRYYNSQVALSTLTITLSERDLQTPATAVESQIADMGIETDDVEKARNLAMKAIDDAKGQIVESQLKRMDAGQLAAKIVADIPPDAAGAVIDQLKQLGKVARLEIQRQQTNSDGSATTTVPLRTERKPTRLLISIYNLANVAPRRTTTVHLAAEDVEAAYGALVAAAKSNGGRVVASNLDRGDPAKATASLVLEVPPEKFELAMSALRAQGDVLKLSLNENPDTQNSTEAKQGLTVQLVSLASVLPREMLQQSIAAVDVPSAYQSVLAAAKVAHARVQSAQLNEQDRQNITADLQLEVPRAELENFDKALANAGGTIARNSTRAAEADGTVDSKVALKLSVTSADHLAPRETTRLQIEVNDVEKSTTAIQASAISAGGRVLESTASNDHGKGIARLALDLPLDKTTDILQQLRNQGTVRGIDSSRDPQAPNGPLAHGQIFVEFATAQAIVADQSSPWASIRQGLATSVTGLMWSLQWVVVGLCLIGPWVVIGWGAWKIKTRMTKV